MIEQRNYAHIPTYVFRADAALDAASASATKELSSTSSTTQHKQRPEEREKIQYKLEFATGLAHLGQGNYEKAALSFLKLGPPSKLSNWIGKVCMYLLRNNCGLIQYAEQLVAPGDIAIYGTLCALSSLSRNAIKAQILENSVFGAYIEQEPYIRELIEAYMGSDFKRSLEILARYSVRVFLPRCFVAG
jgi:hypothetical protein